MNRQEYEKTEDKLQGVMVKLENDIKRLSDNWYDAWHLMQELGQAAMEDGLPLDTFSFTLPKYGFAALKVEFARVNKFKSALVNGAMSVPHSLFGVNEVSANLIKMADIFGFPDVRDGAERALPLSRRFAEWRKHFDKELPSGD